MPVTPHSTRGDGQHCDLPSIGVSPGQTGSGVHSSSGSSKSGQRIATAVIPSCACAWVVAGGMTHCGAFYGFLSALMADAVIPGQGLRSLCALDRRQLEPQHRHYGLNLGPPAVGVVAVDRHRQLVSTSTSLGPRSVDLANAYCLLEPMEDLGVDLPDGQGHARPSTLSESTGDVALAVEESCCPCEFFAVDHGRLRPALTRASSNPSIFQLPVGAPARKLLQQCGRRSHRQQA